MPAELSEAAFLLRIGWTWGQLQDTPDEIVEKMLILLRAEAEVTKEKIKEAQHG